MKNKTVFEYNDKKYYYSDIVDALKKVGIKPGDTIFVHSDLKSFGKITTNITRSEYIEFFIDALKEVVGKTGNIIVPTFSYTFCKKEVYDPLITPSTVGILTEHFRKMKDVKRSNDAIFSAAAYGPDEKFLTDVGTNCFGEKSVFEKLYDKKGKLIFLGDTFDITFMHFAEQRYGVPYRFIKRFPGQIKIAGELKDYVFDYNVKPLDKNIVYDLEKIAKYFDSCGVLHTVPLGFSKIRMVTAVDAFNKITEGFEENTFLLLKEKPDLS